MTEVKSKIDDFNCFIEVKGHSGYSKSGTDIVCAAISMACLMTANLLMRLGNSYNHEELECRDGYFRLNLTNFTDIDKTIVVNLDESLKELSFDYPKYIKYNR